MNIPSESESADSNTCPIMVSGLDDSLGGVEDAPLLRSVIVVVASVPWRAPEECMGRMEGDERGKSMALAPPCTIPVDERGAAFSENPCNTKSSVVIYFILQTADKETIVLIVTVESGLKRSMCSLDCLICFNYIMTMDKDI